MNGWWCCSCMCNNHEAWRPDIMLLINQIGRRHILNLTTYYTKRKFIELSSHSGVWHCLLLLLVVILWVSVDSVKHLHKRIRFIWVGGEPETECVFLIALFSLVVAHNNFTWCHKKRTVGYPEELSKVFFVVTSCCTNIFSRAHMPFIMISFAEEDISIFLHKNTIKFAWMTMQIFWKLPLLSHSYEKRSDRQCHHNHLLHLLYSGRKRQHCLCTYLFLLLHYFAIVLKQKVIHDWW